MGSSQTVKMKSVSVKDVDQHKFVRALAAFFKKSGKVKQPEWTDLVKTAVFKELAPFDEDWLHSHGFIGQTHLHPIPHRSQDGQAHLRRTQEQWCCPLPLLRQLWISCPQSDAGFGSHQAG